MISIYIIYISMVQATCIEGGQFVLQFAVQKNHKYFLGLLWGISPFSLYIKVPTVVSSPWSPFEDRDIGDMNAYENGNWKL